MRSVRQRFYRIYTDRETKDHHLRYLFLEITRRCNLSCRHCGSDCSSDSTMREMTAETWKSVIRYMQKKYRPAFVITGGEPLVRADLFDITDELKRQKATWGIVSNGLTLDSDKLNRLCADGLNSITLSFDGPEDNHHYIRKNPSSYAKVISAMDLISRKKLQFKDAVTCVYPGNLKKLGETADILIEHGMTSWRMFRIFPKGKAVQNPDLILDFEQSGFLVNWIKENRKKLGRKGLNVSFSCEGYLPWKLDRSVRDEPFFCRSGINYASILSDGTVTGCNNNGPAYYQGNIADRDFSEIWENDFKMYRSPSWRKTGICTDCNEWDYCLGNSVHLRNSADAEGPGFCYLYRLSP